MKRIKLIVTAIHIETEKSLYISFNFAPLLFPKQNLHNVEHE